MIKTIIEQMLLKNGFQSSSFSGNGLWPEVGHEVLEGWCWPHLPSEPPHLYVALHDGAMKFGLVKKYDGQDSEFSILSIDLADPQSIPKLKKICKNHTLE